MAGWVRNAPDYRLARTLSGRQPAVLVYHGVPRRARAPGALDAHAFEEQMRFLKRHFAVLHSHQHSQRRRPAERPAVVLTFDDGFRNQAEVVAPVLRKLRLPAIFFISSRHATPGQYLWFQYLKMLRQQFKGNGFRFFGQFMDMSPRQRDETMERLRRMLLEMRPHPGAMYEAIDAELPELKSFVSAEQLEDESAGMTAAQVEELAADPLFSFGVHTVDHPCLTKCSSEEAARQIGENRAWLEAASKRKCDSIAYPQGDYDRQTLQQCRAAGILTGHAVITRFNSDPNLEIPRIGVYSPSLSLLSLKAMWGRALSVERWPRPDLPRFTGRRVHSSQAQHVNHRAA
jgi:peptidoglycan/xylan/chitin deacetylase (PgdA/CDA1 family)